ncbi:class A beta-lactamase [Caballeronia udeis]|nr:class A beta-lactamase [Caballeronia udeis]
MVYSPRRRSLLTAAAMIPFVSACTSWRAATGSSIAQDQLKQLESSAGGRLGVAALNTADGKLVNYRADERFPLCSTFKLMLVSAVLEQSESPLQKGLLERRIHYARSELLSWAPITKKQVATGMTVAELCAATLQYSDNTAANLLMKLVGGPETVTAYARSIGDNQFHLDRREPDLNSAIPGDPRDTSTPAAMAHSLQRVTLGDALGASQRSQLQTWLLGNTTGAGKIAAAMPAHWMIGDKTGSGDYGTTNDIGVIWPPGKPPIVLAIYLTQREQDAKARDDVVASAARIVVAAFA